MMIFFYYCIFQFIVPRHVYGWSINYIDGSNVTSCGQKKTCYQLLSFRELTGTNVSVTNKDRRCIIIILVSCKNDAIHNF